MKIVLFGTGDYYRKYKMWFQQKDVVALLDNNQNKKGTYLDGKKIYTPDSIRCLDFDVIVILSVHEVAMRQQLNDLGIDNERIVGYSELIDHMELCMPLRPICMYAMDSFFDNLIHGNSDDYILLMSHNLDLNGASLALFYAAKILIKNQYKVVFVSWYDGELKRYLLDEGIPVVVDVNLAVNIAKNIIWIRHFNKIICNTLNYYQFLSERRITDKVIWWLHDPEMFYETINMRLLKQVNKTNLFTYAVGPISENAIKKYRPDMDVGQLIYGLPDYNSNRKDNSSDILEIATIGNVQQYKGQDILVQAIKMLSADEREKIHLRIIGPQDSAFADEIKASAKEMKKIIEFVPPINRDEVHCVLDKIDLFICPSRVDTMSISCNEAMQHGIPCIVSDSVGVATYINDGKDGLIFENENVEDLVKKIRWCLYNRDLLFRLGDESRKIYEKYFSMSVFEENLLKIVKKIF